MKKSLATLVLWCAVSSCASIVTGGTDDILITSNPDGAYFRTNLGQTGHTPMSISIPDDQPLSVSYSLDGYEDQSANVGTRLSAWVIGNVVFGGLIGLVVDVVAHGNVHKSDHLHAEMRPLSPEKLSALATKNQAPPKPPQESFDEWDSRRQQPAVEESIPQP